MTQPYQLTLSPGGATSSLILRVADNAFIPADPDNKDYRTYQAWVAAGNTPDPAPTPPAGS